jgi:hypothetical protein
MLAKVLRPVRLMDANGCGFCKATQALETFIWQVTGGYKGLGGDLDYWLRGTPSHVGGNAYEVSLDELHTIDQIRKARQLTKSLEA